MHLIADFVGDANDFFKFDETKMEPKSDVEEVEEIVDQGKWKVSD